ncbi:NAD(P)/FAD-dependent oxidoreductase [Candidatus Burkholderia verschuerenii]|uniref:NAD(P)/FAD-dependent oxidoreductase n=1 Tax=Candidatus Burkholderia verschuerenii TaxID=242163 RepID=UPI00067B8455|nr:FAD-dependent oxidoreductase [Candidatus Burkholderia verschuerenii]
MNPMVIAGAGQCGARTAHALRENGWTGGIVLLGDEGIAPYERPPLSKAVLLGQKSVAQCGIFDDAFFAAQHIELHVDAPVARIDRMQRRVVLGDGACIAYERLLLATGAEPRKLDVPGSTLRGVHVLRNVPDALAIAGALDTGRRIAVIGAGFIGLEVAATAVARGCHVTVLEAAPRALMRAVPEVVAQALIARHGRMGVDVRVNAQVARIEGRRDAGLAIDNGIAVDATLRTSDPYI